MLLNQLMDEILQILESKKKRNDCSTAFPSHLCNKVATMLLFYLFCQINDKIKISG